MDYDLSDLTNEELYELGQEAFGNDDNELLDAITEEAESRGLTESDDD